MKKMGFSILLALTAACVCGRAQDYVRYSAETKGINHIIRSCTIYNTPTEVIYSREDDSGYIELWVEGTATCRIPVPLSYEVKDMRVYNNLLYFCGRRKPCGFIAVLDLHDMFLHNTGSSTPPSDAFISYTYLDGGLVSSLEKMVVYDIHDQAQTIPVEYADQHIAAIGLSGWNITTNDWVAVHLKYDSLFLDTVSSISAANYANYEVLASPDCPKSEPIQEVLKTEHYVAFVRYRQSTNEYIIHHCTKYNIAGTYNWTYHFPAPPDEGLSPIIGTVVPTNNIALATLATYQGNPSAYEIRVRTFDMAGMSVMRSQRIPTDDTVRDLKITYNKDRQKIVLSMNGLLRSASIWVPVFLEIDPWVNTGGITTYTAYGICDNSHTPFNSIDFANGPYFVSSAENIWMRKKLPLSGQSNTCYSTTYFTSDTIPDLETIGYSIEPIYFPKKAEPTRQRVTIYDIQTNIDCIITDE